MSREAELPDGTVLEFPDGTPDDVIDRVVKQHITAKPQTSAQAVAQSAGPENIPSVLSPEFEKRAAGDFGGRLAYSASQVLPSLFKGDQGVRQRAVEAVPGSRVEKDASGAEIVVTPQGERFYVNKPGLDVDDVFRFGGQVASFLPAGRLVRGATLPARIAQAGIGSAATDVAGQAASGQGVDLGQSVLTGLTGAAGQGISEGIVRGATALANTARGAYNRLLAPGSRIAQEATITPGAASATVELTPADNRAAEAIGRIASGGRDSRAALRRGQRVAADTGINLTPGQMTGGKGTTMAENLARQSIWTRDQMFLGDQTRARQMLNAINKTAKAVSPTGSSPEAFATNLQGRVRNMVTDLATARSNFGRQAYVQIEKAAGGAPIVQTNATLDEVAKITDEFSGIQGSDAAAVAKQAEAFFNSLKGAGGITPTKAVNQIQAWEKAARTGSGIFEGVQDRTTAKVLASRLARALHQDLDNTASSAGGKLGDALRNANKGWREYSQKIDALENSALGRIVGEDFADDVAGVAFNRVGPEKVWSRLDALAPSELQTVKDYLIKSSPELWQQYQRLTLERARDIARTVAPSQGSRTLGINSGAFVNALEGGAGKQGINQTGRLKVIFGDAPRIRSILEAGRRIADSTGTNFSGTAPAAEAMGLLGAAGQGVKAAVGAVAPAIGLRQVARSASTPIGRRALPMLETPGVPPWLLALTSGSATAGQGQK